MTLALVHSTAQPVAKVRGAPLHELPPDLYIPPEALEVFLETFEGPLDLLLYLIRKADVDILDIPMARLTEQYLEYVEAMRSKNLELAAEHLVMAAMLMAIKSRMLLPRPKAADDGAVDPRAELVRRLLEYARLKPAAQERDWLPQPDRYCQPVEVWIEQSLVTRLPNVSPADLENAWRSLLARARLRQHHRVTRDELSVREHMAIILRQLAGGEFREFTELFDEWRGVSVLFVSFLALLELAREGLIDVTQAEPYAPIYVKRAAAAATPVSEPS